MNDYADLCMIIHSPVGKHASAPADPSTAGPRRRGSADGAMPCSVPLRVVLERVAVSPWPSRCWSRWVSVVYPPGVAGAESRTLPPAAPPRGDPQPPTPLETPVFFGFSPWRCGQRAVLELTPACMFMHGVAWLCTFYAFHGQDRGHS